MEPYLLFQALPLMQLDGKIGVALLVQHRNSVPPAEVVSQLQRAGTDSKYRQLLHLYLHELFEKDPNAGKDFHGLQVLYQDLLENKWEGLGSYI